MEWLDLGTLWFALVAVLFIGYFVLEGFDFGVGILAGVLADDDTDRRVIINTIGPVWDGNEVWLLTAGGAMFAAFPLWYATVFSSFYLALFLILIALIVRGVAFEFRGKRDDVAWRRAWDLAIIWGSAVPALLWGVALANFVRGIPLGPNYLYEGTLLDLLNPYALLGGLVSLSLFATHGAVYLALKTERGGAVGERAHRLAMPLGTVAAGLLFMFLAWTWWNAVSTGEAGVVPGVVPIAAITAAVAVPLLMRERQHGWAFAATAGAIALTVSTLFMNLYPRLLVSSIDPAYDVTVEVARASDLTLTIMTVATIVFLPIVLLYQGWTYWVFRARVSRASVTAPTDTPVDVLERRRARAAERRRT